MKLFVFLVLIAAFIFFVDKNYGSFFKNNGIQSQAKTIQQMLKNRGEPAPEIVFVPPEPPLIARIKMNSGAIIEYREFTVAENKIVSRYLAIDSDTWPPQIKHKSEAEKALVELSILIGQNKSLKEKDRIEIWQNETSRTATPQKNTEAQIKIFEKQY